MAGSPPRTSCVIPVWNGERHLGETIESVLAQTRPPEELIVVDDGSTDGSAAIAGRYGARVTLVRQPNAGQCAARNRGVAATRGDLVAFIDADDLWHKEKLERQAARFEARPEIEVSVVHARNFLSPELPQDAAAGEAWERYLATPWPNYNSLLVRRSVFEKVGPFDAARTAGENLDWYRRALGAGAVIETIPEVLSFRRIHEGNHTHRRPGDARDAALHLIKEMLDRRRR